MIKPMLLATVLPNPGPCPVHRLPESNQCGMRSMLPRGLRLLAVLAWLLGTLNVGRASAPSNDVCSSAQMIPGSGPFPYLTLPIVDVTDATVSTNDPPLSNPDLVGKVAKS